MQHRGKLGAGAVALAVAPAVALAVAGTSSVGMAQQPAFVPVPCVQLGVTPPAGFAGDTRCGTVTVPQARDHSNKGLRPVVLPVVVYATPSAKGTPLMLLAGGPGESAIDATERVLLETPLGQMLLRERPIIAFDRRGISVESGRTSPDLGAVQVARGQRSERLPVLRDSLKAVTKRFADAGIEFRNFTTLVAIEDIADVAHALGYKKMVVFGASYGTRDALQFMRVHPEMVEETVLDGVAPPNATTLLDSAAIASAAREVFARVVSDCAHDRVCSAQYGDLQQIVERFMQDSGAVRRTARLPEGNGAAWRTLQFRTSSVMSVLGLASASEAVRAEVPRVLLDFASSDTLRSDLAAKVLVAAAADPALQVGQSETIPLVWYTVLCGDRPQGEPFAGNRTLCDAMKVPYSGPKASDRVTSDIPTLLVTSGYDARTPVSLATDAARTLSKGQLVLFPMVGHVAFARPVAMACAAVVIESFLMEPERAPATGCIAGVVPAFSPRMPAAAQQRAAEERER